MLSRLAQVLEDGDRRTLATLFALTLCGGVLETVGVGIIFPYLAFVSEPSLLWRTPLDEWFPGLAALSVSALVLLVSLLFVAFFFVKNGYAVWLQNRQLVFSNAKQVALMHRLLDAHFRRPYERQAEQHSSAVVRELTYSVSEVCNALILTVLFLSTDLFAAAGIVATLLFVDVGTTLIAGGLTVVAGWLFFRKLRGRIALYSQRLHDVFGDLLKQVGEAAGGAKELRVLGVEGYFIDRFGATARDYVHAVKRFHILYSLPRLFMEVLLAVALAGSIVIVITAGQSLAEALPVLGVYAIAAIRIFPMVTRVSNHLNTMQKAKPALETVLASLRDKPTEPPHQGDPAPARPFHTAIRIEGLQFKYRTQQRPLFDAFDLEIRRGERLALIGRSGSGKSTLLDLMLGLLQPQAGVVTVDGADIRSQLRAWRSGIGYIPQHIYLLDDTVRRNVALGVADAAIDDAKVWGALEQAEMAESVRALPLGLDSRVGERGGLLSGGQRQRIGIARALYRDPHTLFMDEATSALDNETEARVLRTIERIAHDRTLVMIAHRLSTVQRCRRVVLLDAGRIVDSGTFQEIALRHRDFMYPDAAEAAAASGVGAHG